MRRATWTTLWGALLLGAAVAVSGCASTSDAELDGGVEDPDAGADAGPGLPQCSDGIDNDGDGLIDYPEDPGCFHPLDNSEEDDCPHGPRCPECADGIDNDSDGRIDWPEDPGCSSASDNDESTLVPTECGTAVPLLPMPVSGIALGSAEAGGTSELSSNGCGGSGAETVYLLVVQEPGILLLSTDFPETTLDTVLYVRTECADPGTELGCNDRASGDTAASALAVEVEPGPYYIIVDAHSNASAGNYKLQAEVRLPEGAACDPEEARCAPGLLCQILGDATETTCVPPQCSDGIDNDGDGLIDYPFDPGCLSPEDNDETDDCPDGPTCPECADGIDNDGDGYTDYPEDPGCVAASHPTENDCSQENDPLGVVTAATMTGTTAGLSNDFMPSCTTFSTAPDKAYVLSFPGDLLSLRLDTAGSSYDTMLMIKEGTCDAADLACNDAGGPGNTSLIQLTDVDAGTYFVVVDGWGSNFGSYFLNVSGVIRAGQACHQSQIDAEIFSCEGGLPCTEGLCPVPQCSDGIDNDGDGLIDYPEDPGCLSPEDNDETDDCPGGPNCPECGDGIDNDGDGLIDWPEDPACLAASYPSEHNCAAESDPIEVVTAPTTTGTTVGATNDFTPSCSTFSTASDVVFELPVPGALVSLDVDTIGSSFDTVLYIKQDTCAVADLACNDDWPGPGNESEIKLTGVEAGRYFLFVDGFSSASGAFVLNVSGVIAAGEACDPDQIDAGIFSCEGGLACTEGLCPVPQCSDGIDNDGDGLIDYPQDPGCLSPDDDDETDDCPSGPNCPECADGIDNDGDGLIDWPADPACLAASHPTEDNCPEESDPISAVTAATTTASTVGLTNDFEPSCTGSTSGPDQVYLLRVPGELASLQVDTIGSTLDTLLVIKQAVCSAADFACDDMSGSGFPTYNSLISLTDVAPGAYYVVVDGWNGGAGDYVLNVGGVIKAGEACDQDQVDAEIFACEGGADCVAGVCADP